MERSRMTRWSAMEDEVVIGYLKQYPTNLGHAFKLASRDLEGRSESSVTQRYHSKIKKTVPVLAIGSGTQALTINTKNSMQQPDGSIYNAGMRNVILNSFFSTMSKEELIEFFMGELKENDKTEMFKKVTRNINRAIK
jgi:hypothetical protein